MTIQARRAVKQVFRAYKNMSARQFCSRAPRYIRQHLPVGLWPPLLIDPRNEASETVELPKIPPVEVEYTGQSQDRTPRQLANFEGTITGPENAVYVYSDATVVGQYPLACIDGKYLLPSWFGVDTPFFLHQKKFLKRNLPLARTVRGVSDEEPARSLDTAFLLLGERGSNIYGWFHEVLPKLWWYERYCKQTGESPVLLLNSPLSSFQEKTLRWMGYDSSSWIAHGRETSHVDRLAVAPHPIRLEGNPSSGFASRLGWVRDRILPNLPEVSEQFSNRIYISRADADRRHVRNEDAVVEMLERRGFERYIPGGLSLEEQATLFAGADVIVGLHGLAHFNLMYCDSETTVLELFPEDGVDESYFVVANELGLSYDCLVFESIDENQNRRPINKDIRVDISRLQSAVDEIIQRVAETRTQTHPSESETSTQ